MSRKTSFAPSATTRHRRQLCRLSFCPNGIQIPLISVLVLFLTFGSLIPKVVLICLVQQSCTPVRLHCLLTLPCFKEVVVVLRQHVLTSMVHSIIGMLPWHAQTGVLLLPWCLLEVLLSFPLRQHSVWSQEFVQHHPGFLELAHHTQSLFQLRIQLRYLFVFLLTCCFEVFSILFCLLQLIL